MDLGRYLENSFILSAVIVLSGVAALFFGKLTGGEFVTLTGIMSTVYGASRYLEAGKP